MPSTDKLKTALKYWYEGIGYHNAVRAMYTASEIHTGFRKDGKTPEIHHQVSICGYLKTIHEGVLRPEQTHIAGWFHDSIEDHYAAMSAIEDKLDWVPLSSVAAMHLLNKNSFPSNEDYYSALSTNDIASIVKGADRIHNHQTMVHVFSAQKINSYIEETQDFVIPMLKKARINFPEQTNAYYNEIHILRTQIELLKEIS